MKYTVCYSLRGAIEIEANSETEAQEFLLNSDYTESSELIKGVELNISESGNDAIFVDDVYKS